MAKGTIVKDLVKAGIKNPIKINKKVNFPLLAKGVKGK